MTLFKIQRKRLARLAFCTLLFLTLSPVAVTAKVFTVGSKSFTESYILSELIAKTVAAQTSMDTRAQQGMGSTGIVFNALKTADIDVYPEYWGTLTQEILGMSDKSTLSEVNQRLLHHGLEAGVFLGFNNAYALAIKRQISEALHLKTIADLKNHPELRLGFSHEFLARKDGWPLLSKAYRLGNLKPVGMEHGLVYQALADQKIDLIDAYTTDSRLNTDDLVLLEDQQHVLTSYQSILLYRIDTVKEHPTVLKALLSLQNTISNESMQSLNAQVELDHQSPASVAQSFLNPSHLGASGVSKSVTPISDVLNFFTFFTQEDFLRLTLEHSALVLSSMFAAMVVGVPIGVGVHHVPRLGRVLLYAVSLLQTIPSLALLSFLIFAVHRIGFLPAFLALFLYALLPIIEATQSGLRAVDRSVIEASKALGTGFWPQLWHIELPLCSASLYAGVQVAAVWTTGTATIAAFVGAGGYGARIAQGLSTNNTSMMLEGAIPAAVFALLMRKVIESIEHMTNKKKS